MNTHPIVSREKWTEARKALLEKEKQLTHQKDALAKQRRELPWLKVEKGYIFDSPQGKVRLADLFGNCSQLIVYHFMFGPEWQEGCPSCSYLVDHLDGAIPHLAARDVALVLVSHAPMAKIEPFRKRMGWHFRWVSSFDSDFNYDFHVSFDPAKRAAGKVEYNYSLQDFPSDEAPGLSVFRKDPSTGEIFHTYSAYERGLDQLIGTYTLLDLVSKGRDEDDLPFSMQWVRHHDRYGTDVFLDENRPYWPPNAKPEMSTSCGCGGPAAQS